MAQDKETVNLRRCPFLQEAMAYIRDNPGCCKRDVILTVHGNSVACSLGRRVPQDTYWYRARALDRLIEAGLLINRGHASCYKLYVAPREAG